MVGSVEDADDVLQDVLARAWERGEQFSGGVPLRSWLSSIAVNASIDHLRRKRRRELLERELDPPWLQPYPTALNPFTGEPEQALRARELMSLAYIVALQRLPPRQRAVLLLRRVVGMSADETAQALSMTVAAANSALQRADARVGPPTEYPPPTAAERDAARRFLAAWESDDVEALVALLAEDVVLTMPPRQESVLGPAAVIAFLRHFVGGSFTRMLSTDVELNGALAFAGHLQAADGTYPASGFILPEARDQKIVRLTVFGAELFARMGLPSQRK